MENITSKNKVAKNTGVLFLRIIITVFISLYSTRLVLNALGESDYGLFILVASSIAMFGFLKGAMANSTQRFLSYALGRKSYAELKGLFSASMVLHFGVAIVLWISLSLVTPYLFEDFLEIDENRISSGMNLFYLMLIGTFFTIVSVPYTAVIMANEDMKVIAVLGVLDASLKLIIAIIITNFIGDRLMLFGVLMAGSSVLLWLIGGGYVYYTYKEATFNIIKYFDKRKMKELIIFSGWSFLGIASTMITSQGQNIMLNMFFGTLVNAAHGIADQVRGQLSVLSTVLMQALNPAIIKHEGAGDKERMLDYTFMGSRLSFFLLLLVLLPIAIELPIILKIWLKEVPEYTIVFCRLLLIRSLLEQLFIPLMTAIGAVGNIKSLNIGFVFVSLFPLPITWWLFSMNYPPYVMYLVFITYSIIWSLLILIVFKIKCKSSIKYFISSTMLPSISVLLLILPLPILCYSLFEESVFRLILNVSISSVSALCFIFFIGLNKSEKNACIDFIKTKIG